MICGPTASGKTALAVAAAKRLGGEIICADSMQIYAILNVGTARPTPAEQAGVPHHLYGFVDPAEAYSVSDYLRDARRAIAAVAARGRVPILCGGTGLYIRSLLDGLRFDGAGPDEELRRALYAQYDRCGGAALIERIAAVDPGYAATLHPNNAKRIVRALELIETTGRCVTAQNASSRDETLAYPACSFLCGCERETLYARIDRRVDAMLAAGLLAEARLVYDNRARYKTAAQAIGYKEFFPLFEGRAAEADCAAALKTATRHYAKRQMTWWRREADLVPLDLTAGDIGQAVFVISSVWESYRKRIPEVPQ